MYRLYAGDSSPYHRVGVCEAGLSRMLNFIVSSTGDGAFQAAKLTLNSAIAQAYTCTFRVKWVQAYNVIDLLYACYAIDGHRPTHVPRIDLQ